MPAAKPTQERKVDLVCSHCIAPINSDYFPEVRQGDNCPNCCSGRIVIENRNHQLLYKVERALTSVSMSRLELEDIRACLKANIEANK